MSLQTILDLGLALLTLAVTAWTIAARETFAAVVRYVVAGLLLSLVWVRLYAPDVAMTESTIGAGVTGVLLIGAANRLGRGDARPDETVSLTFKLVAAALCLAVTAALATAVLMLPDPVPSLAPDAMANLAPTGMGNPVTAALMAFRGFDTMLETVVLTLAAVGVWSLAPNGFWGGAPEPVRAARPEGALVFLAQILAPIGLVVGVHLLWVSKDEPGGAFQGGAVMAAMWLLAVMARLAEPPEVRARWLRYALAAGPAVFLLAGLSGLPLAGVFFGYPEGFATPVILTIEVFKLFAVAVTLALLVWGPPARKASA
jgi:multisubunit Na+/H+ antiporter MnhB subunit